MNKIDIDSKNDAAIDLLEEPLEITTLRKSEQYQLPYITRVCDILISVVLLIAFLPVLVVIGIILRLDSGGPVLFKQVRVGRNKENFHFYKFRTMKVNARELHPELYFYNFTSQQIESICFKIVDDPRLTRFGRILRKTSLDELPNLMNVIKGDMSLVGPRPEIPEMLKYYKPLQELKFSVKPGVTGFAQVRGRGLLSFQETIALDLEYVRTENFKVYFSVLFKTAKAVIKGIGAF